MIKKIIASLQVLVWFSCLMCWAGESFVSVTTGGDNGCFNAGVPVEFSVKTDGATTVLCEVTFNEKPLWTKVMSTNADGNLPVTVEVDKPGNVRLMAKLADESGKALLNGDGQPLAVGYSGAMINSTAIYAAGTEPEDFDEFWKNAKEELARVPLKAVEVPKSFADSPDKNFARLSLDYDFYDVKVDCAGGAPVSGILTIPKNALPKSLPAVVFYYSYCVGSAWPRIQYRERAMTLEVNAHGIENLQGQDYYNGLWSGRLAGYQIQGVSNPKTYYFYGMYLRVMRALEYMKSRPEWNGKVLVAMGGSQGGAQAIFAGAMDKDVTFVLADVPALCDLCGGMKMRPCGWPRFVSFDENGNVASDCHQQLVTAGYFDSAFFARRMKAREIYFSTGLVDGSCHPDTVFAAYNEVPENVKKQIVTYPDRGHWPPSPAGEVYMIENVLEKFGHSPNEDMQLSTDSTVDRTTR